MFRRRRGGGGGGGKGGGFELTLLLSPIWGI